MGPWLVICAACLAAGLAFDFSAEHDPAFWIAAEPGAAAAIGAGAAAFSVIAAIVARFVLARRGAAKGGGDAGHS